MSRRVALVSDAAGYVGPNLSHLLAERGHDLAPMEECSAAGPHTNWPLQKGFDRFYGFLQGETDQFHPELTSFHIRSLADAAEIAATARAELAKE